MLSTLLCLVLPAIDVEPAIPVPKGKPPTIATVQVEGDQILATPRIQPNETQVRQVPVNINGRVVMQQVQYTLPRLVIIRQVWSLKKATAQRVDGTKIELAELKKLLAKPATVVLSGDGKPVDPGYLAPFKKDTIVIVAPSDTPATPPPPVPPKP